MPFRWYDMHISMPFALDGTRFAGPAHCRTSRTLRLRSTKGWKAWLSGEGFLSNVPQVRVAVGGTPGMGAGVGATAGVTVAGRGMMSADGGAPR